MGVVRPVAIGGGSLMTGKPDVVESVELENVLRAEAVAGAPPAMAPVAPQVERVAAAPMPAEAATVLADAGAAEAVAVDRKIIRTATLAIVVSNVGEAAERARAVVEATPGAFIASSNVQGGDDPTRISSLTVRVPADQFDRVLAALRAIGQAVINEDVVSRDVTEEFTDVDARLRNAEAAELQLLAILEQAENVEDTLDVHRELARVREDIEVMQGRLNVLRNQTELATLTVVLHPAPDVSVELEVPTGALLHEQMRLTVRMRNEGTVEVDDVEVRTELDPGMIFEGASMDGRYDPAAHAVVWTIDRLHPFDERHLTVDVRLEGAATEMAARAAFVTSSPEAGGDNNRAEGTVRFHIDLSVTKDGSVAVPIGSDAEYELTFANRGTGDASNVRIVERLPDGMTFVRAGGGGHYDEAQHAIVWDFARLGPAARDVVSYVARVDRGEGRLLTETAISSDESDRAPADNTATTFLTALPERVEDRAVWSPGTTARDSVGALAAAGQWIADAAITVGIVAVPFAAVVALVAVPVLVIRRRRRR